MRNPQALLAALFVVAVATSDVNQIQAEGWGSISGQITLKGDVPKPKVVIKMGDSKVKDFKCCAEKTLYDNTLIVHPKTKGIRHIFVYLRKVNRIHPDLKESKKKELEFDQKNCRFEPHTMLLRTDQTVYVKSNDPIGHNTHTNPIRQDGINLLITPNDREGVKMTLKNPEFLPTKVNCDIHPWMSAYWMVLDHPYMTITDENGKFKIDKLPEGEHDFLFWQERCGWLYTKKDDDGNRIWQKKWKGGNWVGKKCTVTVKDGKTNKFPAVEFPLAWFPDPAPVNKNPIAKK